MLIITEHRRDNKKPDTADTIILLKEINISKRKTCVLKFKNRNERFDHNKQFTYMYGDIYCLERNKFEHLIIISSDT